MHSESDGGPCRVPAEERLNIFALVIYIPDPLGGFLDELRRELVPHYNPHAHVSVLPPRPLAVDWRVVSEQVRVLTDAWSPFEIGLGAIDVFPVTNVIFLELDRGAKELHRLHEAMNQGQMKFDEPFRYHPHVTLAQEVPGSQVDEIREKAQRRWRQYDGPRRFLVERAVFVQNTRQDCWIDLDKYQLGAVPVG
jgi:2'-5' RNA ligase